MAKHVMGWPATGAILALLGAALAAGCASGGGLAELDSNLSPCQEEYREYRSQPPVPSGLSREERDRYEERGRDYHVSQGCQREAESEATVIEFTKKPRGG